VNNSRPYIKPNNGYNTVRFLTLITLGFYTPYILLLAEHYGRHDIKVEYEDTLKNMRFYDSKVILTEKLNIEAFNKLIKLDNSRDFGDF